MAEAGSSDVEPLSWTAYAAVGLGWYLALTALPWLGLEGATSRLWVSAAAMVGMGGLCWYNGRACGALHCRVSGPGYVIVGLVAVAAALGIVSIGIDTLIWAFVGVAAASFAVEAALDRTPDAA